MPTLTDRGSPLLHAIGPAGIVLAFLIATLRLALILLCLANLLATVAVLSHRYSPPSLMDVCGAHFLQLLCH
jgi:hypothetical protein